MRKAFVIISTVLLLDFVLQFAFAAVGAFTKPGGDGAYSSHSINGTAIIPALILLTTLFAALAKAPGKVIGLSLLSLGLVIVQALIAMLAKAFTSPEGTSTTTGLIIAALHALNAIAVVHVVVGVWQAARRLAQPVEAA